MLNVKVKVKYFRAIIIRIIFQQNSNELKTDVIYDSFLTLNHTRRMIRWRQQLFKTSRCLRRRNKTLEKVILFHFISFFIFRE